MNVNEIIAPRDEPTNIGGIDYPDEVIRALLERRLVVFAGAGVSMGPPALLPSFAGLVGEIAAGTGLTQGADESHDKFLGVLQSKGVEVHHIAAKKLSDRDPKPTQMHSDLVRLAGPSDGTQIVTTNFDTLFETAAGDAEIHVPYFNAPALPLGSSFNGIVDLHGSLNEPEGMVLTDGDVGRAYITQGWARRFLVQLFGNHTVLFVGYSHGDLMPRYLTTAIRDIGADNLFMLLREDDSNDPTQFGLMPIRYHSSDHTDHSELHESIKRIGMHFSREPEAWRKDIAEACEDVPPPKDQTAETVRLALRRPETLRMFANGISSVSWVEWLSEIGELECVFTSDGDVQTVDLLSRTVALVCIANDPEYLVRMIESRDFRMSDQIWQSIAFAVSQSEPGAIKLAQWISILLRHQIPQMDIYALTALANGCIKQGDVDGAMLLFDYLIEPRFVGVNRYTPGPDHHVKINEDAMRPMSGSQAVSRCLVMLENADDRTRDQVVELGIRSFERRHMLLKVWGKARDEHDEWSTIFDPFNRPEDEPLEGFSLVLDQLRRSVRAKAASCPDQANSLCNRLAGSRSPVLRRLAVDTVVHRDDMDPEEKVSWLMTRTRPGDDELVSEKTRLADRNFAGLSQDSQIEFVEWLLSSEIRPERHRDVLHAKRARWLNLLAEVDPASSVVQTEIATLQRIAPGALETSYPERPVYIGEAGFIEHPKPYTAEQLKSMSPSECVQRFDSWEPPKSWIWGDGDDANYGFVREVVVACKSDPHWWHALIRHLVGVGNYTTDLWKAVLHTGPDTYSQIADWDTILDAAENLVQRHDVALELTRTINALAETESGDSTLLRGGAVIEQLLDATDDGDLRWVSDNGYVSASLNTVSGVATEYWICLANRVANGEFTASPLNTAIKVHLEQILDAQSPQSAISKATVGTWLDVLYRFERDWTVTAVLPMFKAQAEHFAASWEGFLFNFSRHRWLPVEMHDYVGGMVPRLREINVRDGARPAGLVAFMCCYRDQTLSDQLVKSLFNRDDSPDDIAYDVLDFTSWISYWLKISDSERRQRIWNSWLRGYVERRKMGLPKGLVEGESWAMLKWIPVLLPVAPDALDLITSLPTSKDGSLSIYSILFKVDVNEHPVEYAKLVLHVDKLGVESTDLFMMGEYVNALIENDALPGDLRLDLENLKLRNMME